VAANAAFGRVLRYSSDLGGLRSDYQLSNGQLGLALGLLSLGVAGELPWGLTDRLGDRKVLLAGLLGTSAALGC
jgi:hypothetical protein